MTEPEQNLNNSTKVWIFNSCTPGDPEIQAYISTADLSVKDLIEMSNNQNTTAPRITIDSLKGQNYGFRLSTDNVSLTKGSRYHVQTYTGDNYLYIHSYLPEGNSTASGWTGIKNCEPKEGYVVKVSSCRYKKDILDQDGCQQKIKEVYIGPENQMIEKLGSSGQTLEDLANDLDPNIDSGSNQGSYVSFRIENGREGECFIVHGLLKVYSSNGESWALVKKRIDKLTNWENRDIVKIGRVIQDNISENSECKTNQCDTFTSVSEYCFKPTPTPDIRKQSWWVYSHVYHWNCSSIYNKPVRDDQWDGWIYMGTTPYQKIDYEEYQENIKKRNDLETSLPNNYHNNETWKDLNDSIKEVEPNFTHDWNNGPPAPYAGLGNPGSFNFFEEEEVFARYKAKIAQNLEGDCGAYKMSQYKPNHGGVYIGDSFVMTVPVYVAHSDDNPDENFGDHDVGDSYDSLIKHENWVNDTKIHGCAPCEHDGKRYIDPNANYLDIGSGSTLTISSESDSTNYISVDGYQLSVKIKSTKDDSVTVTVTDENNHASSITLNGVGATGQVTSNSPPFTINISKIAEGSSKLLFNLSSSQQSFGCYSFSETTDNLPSGGSILYSSDVVQLPNICYEECNPSYGCTDPTACNYDASATRDDGSCTYDICYGCTDPEANNTNPNADKPCEDCPADKEDCCDDDDDWCLYDAPETPTPTAGAPETPTLTLTPTPTQTHKYLIVSKCLCDFMQLTNKVDLSPFAVYTFDVNDPPYDSYGNIIVDGDTLGQFASLPALAGTPHEGCINVKISDYNSTNLSVSGEWNSRPSYSVGDVQRGFHCPEDLYQPCSLDCKWFKIQVTECDCDGFTSGSSRIDYKSLTIIPSGQTFHDNGKCYASLMQTVQDRCNYYNVSLPEVPTSDPGEVTGCKDCLEYNDVCYPTPTPGKWTVFNAKLCLEEDYVYNGRTYNGCDPEKWGDGRSCFPYHPDRRGKYKSSFGEIVEDGFKCTPDGSVYIEVIEQVSGNYFDWEQDPLEIHNVTQYNDTDGCGCSC